MLGGSDVSPLQMKLVKEEQLFNAAECFYLRGFGEGLFVLYGIMNDGVSHQDGEAALIRTLKENQEYSEGMDRSYTGVKNRHATNLLFEATQPMQLAQRLCFFENAGALNNINNEQSLIESFSLNDVLTVSKKTIDANSVSVIYYHPKK